MTRLVRPPGPGRLAAAAVALAGLVGACTGTTSQPPGGTTGSADSVGLGNRGVGATAPAWRTLDDCPRDLGRLDHDLPVGLADRARLVDLLPAGADLTAVRWWLPVPATRVAAPDGVERLVVVELAGEPGAVAAWDLAGFPRWRIELAAGERLDAGDGWAVVTGADSARVVELASGLNDACFARVGSDAPGRPEVASPVVLVDRPAGETLVTRLEQPPAAVTRVGWTSRHEEGAAVHRDDSGLDTWVLPLGEAVAGAGATAWLRYLDDDTGAVAWELPVGDGLVAGERVAWAGAVDGRLIVATDDADGVLRLLVVGEAGQVAQAADLPALPESVVAVRDGLVIGLEDGSAVATDVSSAGDELVVGERWRAEGVAVLGRGGAYITTEPGHPEAWLAPAGHVGRFVAATDGASATWPALTWSAAPELAGTTPYLGGDLVAALAEPGVGVLLVDLPSPTELAALAGEGD